MVVGIPSKCHFLHTKSTNHPGILIHTLEDNQKRKQNEHKQTQTALKPKSHHGKHGRKASATLSSTP
jgi:hypothetical protein